MLDGTNMFTVGPRKTATEYFFKSIFLPNPAAEKIDPIIPYIRPGTCVIDVGAHVGYFTRRFAKANPGGVVLAFEPQSMPRAILTASAFFRRMRGRVVCLPFALGDAPALLKLNIPIKRNGNVGIGLAHTGQDPEFTSRFNVKNEIVSCVRLDDVMARFAVGPISLIKIDVEGAELNVLRGGAATIDKYRPVVVCEIDAREHRFGATPDQLLQFFESRSYEARDLMSGEVLAPGAFAKNTVFVPKPEGSA